MWIPKIPPCPLPLREFFLELIERINDGWPMDGTGIKVGDAVGGGRSINAVGTAGGAGSSSVIDFPYQTFIQGNADDGFQRGVEFDSPLIPTVDHSDTQSITGLLTTHDKTGTDSGWGVVAADDDVWLEIEFGAWPDISTASIRSTSIDGDMGPEIEHDGATPPVQTKARLLLSHIVADGSGLRVQQWVRSPLRMEIAMTNDAYLSDFSDQKPVFASYPYPVG